MKIEKTFQADLYIGTSSNSDYQYNRKKNAVYFFIQEYCDIEGDCFSIQEVKYIYTNGNERGFKITAINYPRFPSTPEEIKKKMIKIASALKKILNQRSCSIVCSDETIWIEQDD